MSRPFVIGSRGSKLALWQAGWVRDRMAEAGYKAEIKVIKTAGDKLLEAPLAQSGVKGLFIKEIEAALLSGAVDLAVHSLKDLPVDQPAGLTVAAVPKRDDARDVVVLGDGRQFSELVAGARIGTSSLRRQAQLHHLCPGFKVVSLRGNVDTRLRKLERGDCDALVLAGAGLLRLGLDAKISGYLPVEQMCPAVGQGALAIEVRQDDERIAGAIRFLDHPPTHRAVAAERAVLRRLGGGCAVPIAAYASQEEDGLRLMALVASPDGSRLIRAAGDGPPDNPEALGGKVADDLVKQGAFEILHS